MCRKAIKRDLFSKVDYSSYYHIRRGEDLLQSLDVLKQSRRVAFAPVELYNYTINPTSVTHTVSYENYNPEATVNEKVLQFLREEDIFNIDDYVEYKTACIESMMTDVIMILSFKTRFGNKRRLLNELRESSYCNDFLCVGKRNLSTLGKRKLLYKLFEKKRYFSLHIVSSIYFTIKNTAKK